MLHTDAAVRFKTRPSIKELEHKSRHEIVMQPTFQFFSASSIQVVKSHFLTDTHPTRLSGYSETLDRGNSSLSTRGFATSRVDCAMAKSLG